MKKLLAIALAVLMCAALFTACASGGTSPSPKASGSNAPATSTSPASGEAVEVQIMLIKNGDNNDAEVAQVTEAINARLKELGLGIKAKLFFTPWNYSRQQQEMQTGSSTIDIFPSGIGDSAIDYVLGAKNGQYIRLDAEDNNLLEKYGKGLYEGVSDSVKSVAKVNGSEGVGIYAYVISKDINAQLGYIVNTKELEALGFSLADIKPNDITSFEPIFAAFKEKYPDKYPLNCEPEVLARAVTKTTYLDATTGPLGYEFTDAGAATVISRYETEAYKNFIAEMRGFNEKHYVDPDQQNATTAPDSYLRRLGADKIDWIISCAPSAGTAGQVKDADAAAQFVSAYNIMTNESVGAAALSVYAGSKHQAEAVQLLNAIVTDQQLGDLFTAGIETTNYAKTDKGLDVLTHEFRWYPWRYGVLGNNSKATPWIAFGADGEEWTAQKAANEEATALDSVGFIFDRTPVATEMTGVINAIGTYSIMLGSGAGSQADYDAFVAELKAANIDKVIDEAKNQYDTWKASK